MKRSALLPKLVLALLLVSIPVSVSGTGISLFHADFEADAVGSKPSALPPGDPPKDQMAVRGTAEVISSGPLGSNALQIARHPTHAVVECVAVPGPYTSGLYDVRLKQYATVDEFPLEVSVQSRYHGKALVVTYMNGHYTLVSGDGTEGVAGTYPTEKVHSIHIRVNMDTRRFTLRINGTAVASDRPFFEDLFQDLYMLRIDYVPSTVVPIPEGAGECVVDDITIEKSTGASQPGCWG